MSYQDVDGNECDGNGKALGEPSERKQQMSNRAPRPEWFNGPTTLVDLDPEEAYQMWVYILRLEGDLREKDKALNALPLGAFDKNEADIDAAEFVDHAADFVEAMRLARAALGSTAEAEKEKP